MMKIKSQYKKNIILAVTGGIAAYKACELARLFIKSGAAVKVVMTESAENFIHPNTFSALTGNPVYTDIFSDPMLHIDLAKWADEIIIAPATAATISRIASGLAEDLLTTICIATKAKIFIAPAMNTVMWSHPSTQRNINTLKEDGYQIIEPTSGQQACGDIGFGRLAEPESIFETISSKENTLIKNIHVLITAGPTQENIDPVRYISNFSSGKMGYAIAEAFQEMGATVTIVTGPTHLAAPPHCELLQVKTANDMLDAVNKLIHQNDIFISAAAVSDYQAKHLSSHKIKKTTEPFTLELMKTRDILENLAQQKHSAFIVGFCAETDNLLEQAKIKLTRKKLDVIIANEVREDGFPFHQDDNEVVYLTKEGKEIFFEKENKKSLAIKLVEHIMEAFSESRI
jgi:phosphopantothenoylcysteine decarboxylase / phosphopantothenate---cysteine ligase